MRHPTSGSEASSPISRNTTNPQLPKSQITEILSRGDNQFWRAATSKEGEQEFLLGWALDILINWEIEGLRRREEPAGCGTAGRRRLADAADQLAARQSAEPVEFFPSPGSGAAERRDDARRRAKGAARRAARTHRRPPQEIQLPAASRGADRGNLVARRQSKFLACCHGERGRAGIPAGLGARHPDQLGVEGLRRRKEPAGCGAAGRRRRGTSPSRSPKPADPRPPGFGPGHQHGAPGWRAQPHDLPAHARRPSITAQPAIPSATTPSSHQVPHQVLAASPANTAIAR